MPSTFDDFFDAAWADPNVVASLPIITSEIGDGWLYGVPSDPLKNAQFRALARHRRACLESGRCSPDAKDMKRFERLLVKVPEHTWGESFQDKFMRSRVHMKKNLFSSLPL